MTQAQINSVFENLDWGLYPGCYSSAREYMGQISVATWNSWSPSEQGSNSEAWCTRSGGPGGGTIKTNTSDLKISQNALNVSLGTPISTTKTGYITGECQYYTTTNKTKIKSEPVSGGSLTISLSQGSTTSTTTGWSNTSSVNIGTTLTAGIDAANNIQLSTSITNSATINSSDSNGTNNMSEASYSYPYGVPALKPGQSYGVYSWADQQYVTVPYTAPVEASGNATMTWDNIYWYTNYTGFLDLVKNTHTVYGSSAYSGQDDLIWAHYYNSPASAAIGWNGEVDGWAMEATGVINATELVKAHTVYFIPGSPDAPNTKSKMLLTATDNNNPANTAELDFGDHTLEVGLMFTTDNEGRDDIFTGTNKDDLIELRGEGQTAYLFGGNDHLKGSQYADRVIAADDGIGTDEINTYEGNDIIDATNGAHTIISGKGDDLIRLTADKGNLVDDITLGEGFDQLTIDLSNDVKETAFLVRDLTRDDDLVLENGSLDTKIIGSSVELFNDGSHVGTLLGYVSEFNELNGSVSEVIDFSLLNMSSIEEYGTDQSLNEWRENLITADIQGVELINSYDELTNNKSEFRDNTKSLQRLLFDNVGKGLTDWAVRNRNDYANIGSFTSALASKRKYSYPILERINSAFVYEPWLDAEWLNHNHELPTDQPDLFN